MVPTNCTLIPVCSNLLPSLGRIVTAPLTVSPSRYSRHFSRLFLSNFTSTVDRSSVSWRTMSMSRGVENEKSDIAGFSDPCYCVQSCSARGAPRRKLMGYCQLRFEGDARELEFFLDGCLRPDKLGRCVSFNFRSCTIVKCSRREKSNMIRSDYLSTGSRG